MGHEVDDEQMVFKRAKRTVEILHKAKRNEKMIR